MLLVRHRTLGVYRAAKVISKQKQNVEKLLHEANLIKNLEHPGIPLIYDIEEDDNSICIIEEYIAGKSLREYMEENKHIKEGKICQFFIELCSILDYIHNNEHKAVIHLDLKPDNIMIDEKEHTWLIDFDNAIEEEHAKENCQGTRFFAAPEQYHRLKLDIRADVYSVGMLLLYMANNQDVQSPVETIRLNHLYPIIRKCLHHNPSQRYQSMHALLKDLKKCQAESKEKIGNEHSIVIHVKGVKHGVGATHLCLAMAAVLKKSGHTVICIDQSMNDHMFQEGKKGALRQDGTYLCKGIKILPNYEDGIICQPQAYQIIMIDEGVREKENQENTSWGKYCYDTAIQNVTIVLTDGKYGKKEEQKVLEGAKGKISVFVNHMNGMQFYKYMKNSEYPFPHYPVPCIYNWEKPGNAFEETVHEFLNTFAPKVKGKNSKNWLEAACYEMGKLHHKV